MAPLIYDTGALLAAERRDRPFLILHEEHTQAGVRPIVPVVVIAQAWRGGPQPRLSRLLKGCNILSDTESIGRQAGTACAKSGTADVVDAIVVVTAVRHEAVIVTSDPDDMSRIADALNTRLTMHIV